MIAGASGGVEPLFGLVFSRLIMDGTEMLEINPIFKDYAVKHGFYSEELMKEIAKTGSVAHVDGVDEKVKHIFATAHDVSPYWHVKMQAAFQLHTDNAVSKQLTLKNTQPELILKKLIFWLMTTILKELLFTEITAASSSR